MMVFEVQVPAESGYATKLQVQARTWVQACAAALERTSATEGLSGAYVDLRQDGVYVTVRGVHAPLVVRPMDESDAPKAQLIQALTGAMPAIRQPVRSDAPAGPPTGPPVTDSKKIGYTDKSTGMFRGIGAADISQQVERKKQVSEVSQSTEPEARVLQEATVPDAKPAEAAAAQAPAGDDGPIAETALEDVFLDIQTIFEPDYAMEDAIDFVTDLAFKSVPSEHGVLLFANDTADHLYAAAARGPAQQKLMAAEIAIEKGIPATSLQHGVTITLADAPRDKRYAGALEPADVKAKSMVVAPVQHGERAFGVLIVCNRQGRGFYTEADANIISYIGSQMGKFIQQLLDQAPLE